MARSLRSPSSPFHRLFLRSLSCLSFFAFLALLSWLPLSLAWAETSLRFLFKPPPNVRANVSLTISGQVPGNDDLDDVVLFFRRQGDSAYRSKRMTLYAGDFYRTTLEAFQVRPPSLEFYILGQDTSKRSLALLGSPQTPIRLAVAVGPAPTPDPKRPDDPKTPGDPDAGLRTEPSEDEGTVFSAARKEQRIQRAPGVVTVITSSDIEACGCRSVVELLRWTVGIDLNNNGHWPDLGIRGVNPVTTYGDKIIVLLDGHDISFRQFFRNYHLMWLSIDNIQRIEIIRGPGSTLWGANALSGVINIITKTGQAFKGISSTLGGSPLSQSYFLSLQGGYELPNGLSVRAAFSLQRENRSARLAPLYEFRALSDADYAKLNQFRRPADGSTFQRTDYYIQGDDLLAQTFSTQIAWRGFSLTVHQSHYDPRGPLSTFSRIGGDDSRFTMDRWIARLSWATLLGSWGTLLAWTSYDSLGFSPGAIYEDQPLDKAKRNLVKMVAQDHRFSLGSQLSVQFLPNFSLSTGADFEYLNLLRLHFPAAAEDTTDDFRFSNIHFSAFLQTQFSFADIIEFTLGGRLDYDEIYGFVATPRAAAVLTPGVGFFAKFLYGNAFKAPSFHDLYFFRKDAFYGNPSVRPESVHTFEVQVGWSRRKLLAVSLNGYLSLFQDLISYTTRQAGTPLENEDRFPSAHRPSGSVNYAQKANTDQLTIYGGELEFRLYPVQGFNLLANAGIFLGHKGGLTTPPTSGLEYSAWLTASISASYRFSFSSFDLLLSLGALFVSPKNVPPRDLGLNTGLLPASDTSAGQPLPIPQWSSKKDDPQLPFDPSIQTPFYVQSYATIQFLRIARTFDLVFRFSNLLNLDIYDASDRVFYPQPRFDFYGWLRFRV